MSTAANGAEPRPTTLPELEESWREAWLEARVVFSRFTRLRDPIFCLTQQDEKREGLVGSFAMIRLRDLAVVISLRQVRDLGLARFAKEILAHEVGHHVHAPGNLRDQGRLLGRIRFGLGSQLHRHAPLVANLYADLLLNDRLQRSAGLDMAGVYAALRIAEPDDLWAFYTRTYERLWGLKTGTLGADEPSPAIDRDADLAARIVRIFRSRWLDGAASFARICREYLLRAEAENEPPKTHGWLDTTLEGGGSEIPDGLAEDEGFEGETENGIPVHPSEDPTIAGEVDAEGGDAAHGQGENPLGSDGAPDRRTVRTPREFVEILSALGVERSPKDMVIHYYKELARGKLIPFPADVSIPRGDPLPEGLDLWEPGNSLERIDWMQTLFRSPIVIPGFSTVERTYGLTEGGEPERKVPDLYVGVDCSGSMGNPAQRLSYPALAGTVILLSALRAGARAMVCLSGEWKGVGKYTQTNGFIRDERALLGTLTDYLGTGASFGLPRLRETFADAPPRKRKTHILVVSDSDLFGEINNFKDGWETLARAVQNAGGGATAALRLANLAQYDAAMTKMRECGMEPYLVSTEAELVAFARAFSRRTFGSAEEKR